MHILEKAAARTLNVVRSGRRHLQERALQGLHPEVGREGEEVQVPEQQRPPAGAAPLGQAGVARERAELEVLLLGDVGRRHGTDGGAGDAEPGALVPPVRRLHLRDRAGGGVRAEEGVAGGGVHADPEAPHFDHGVLHARELAGGSEAGDGERVERARRGGVLHGEEDLVEADEARVGRQEARRRGREARCGGAVQELRPDGPRLLEVPGLGARDHQGRRVGGVPSGGPYTRRMRVRRDKDEVTPRAAEEERKLMRAVEGGSLGRQRRAEGRKEEAAGGSGRHGGSWS
jgi:hypothetical protein